jgi:hypothetical protein
MSFSTIVWNDPTEQNLLLSLMEETDAGEGEIEAWHGDNVEEVKSLAIRELIDRMLALTKQFRIDVNRLCEQTNAIRATKEPEISGE